MFIFMAGNLSDGYVAFGPYETFGDAADTHEWQDGWIMELHNAFEISEHEAVYGSNRSDES